MRTTVDISDELLRQAKRRAADDHATLREVVENALRFYLEKPRNTAFKLRWRTEAGKLRPGIRLDSRDALFDIMEGRR